MVRLTFPSTSVSDRGIKSKSLLLISGTKATRRRVASTVPAPYRHHLARPVPSSVLFFTTPLHPSSPARQRAETSHHGHQTGAHVHAPVPPGQGTSWCELADASVQVHRPGSPVRSPFMVVGADKQRHRPHRPQQGVGADYHPQQCELATERQGSRAVRGRGGGEDAHRERPWPPVRRDIRGEECGGALVSPLSSPASPFSPFPSSPSRSSPP